MEGQETDVTGSGGGSIATQSQFTILFNTYWIVQYIITTIQNTIAQPREYTPQRVFVLFVCATETFSFKRITGKAKCTMYILYLFSLLFMSGSLSGKILE